MRAVLGKLGKILKQFHNESKFGTQADYHFPTKKFFCIAQKWLSYAPIKNMH